MRKDDVATEKTGKNTEKHPASSENLTAQSVIVNISHPLGQWILARLSCGKGISIWQCSVISQPFVLFTFVKAIYFFLFCRILCNGFNQLLVTWFSSITFAPNFSWTCWKCHGWCYSEISNSPKWTYSSCEKAEQLQRCPWMEVQEGSVAVYLISMTFNLNIPI